jgi:DNA-binding NtrC family response regulator
MSVPPKILYIDDEHDLLHLASSFFEEENLPIDTCSNFSEALEKIRNGAYDLVISDARMPSGTGKELLSIIKSEKLNCGKFILITGNPDFADQDDKDNYDMILFKPFKFSDLIDRSRSMLKI